VRPLLYRELYGFELRRAGFSSWLEPPRPAVTLMIDLEGSITAGGGPLPTAWIGGLDESPTVVGLRGGDYASVDIELTPLGAYTILGRPLAELEGACVPLEDAFGAAGRELADRLRERRDWDTRFDALERFLLQRVAAGRRRRRRWHGPISACAQPAATSGSGRSRPSSAAAAAT
jgi:hypothetical protein